MESTVPFVPALIVVDMQNDFCPPNGALAVQGGRDIIPDINKLLSYPFAIRIATQDFHPRDHCSFAVNHPPPNNVPFTSEFALRNPLDPKNTKTSQLWPVHCVQETAGSKLVSELDKSKIDLVVTKGQDKDVEMYSAFEDPFGGNKTVLTDELIKHSVTHVYVVGLAMDYCVKSTALDAAKVAGAATAGATKPRFKTLVITDATRAVTPENVQSTSNELKQAGVVLVGMKDEAVEVVRKLSSDNRWRNTHH